MGVNHKRPFQCNDLSDQNSSLLVKRLSKDLCLSNIFIVDILLNGKAENNHPKFHKRHTFGKISDISRTRKLQYP